MTYCPMYYMYPLNILLLSQQNQKRNKLESLCIQELQCMHLILTFVHWVYEKRTYFVWYVYVCVMSAYFYLKIHCHWAM